MSRNTDPFDPTDGEGGGGPGPYYPPAPPPATEPPPTTGTSTPTAAGYVAAVNPEATVRSFTINDKTYILNTEVVVGLIANVEGTTIAGTAQSLQDTALDAAAEGSIWQIVGDPDNAFDTYYAKKISGKWFEWSKPGIDKQFDEATMPVVINIDSTTLDYTLTSPVWAQMTVGDEKSNKKPSFVDRTIRGMFSIGDRLGFLSGQGYIMSETAQGEPAGYLNFWRNTVTDVLDTQRIDGTVASDVACPLLWAKSVGKSMILFGDTRQFSMDWIGAVTPRTLSATPATSFSLNGECQPALSGTNLYFAGDAGNHSSVMEMFIQEQSVTTKASDITAHCPTYIAGGLILMETAPNYDMIFCVSKYRRSYIYVHSSMWNKGERIQSAWNRWLIGNGQGVSIKAMKVVAEYLHVIYTQEEGLNRPLFHGRISLKAGDPGIAAGIFPHPVHLDHLQLIEGTYDGGTGLTTFASLYPYGNVVDQLELVYTDVSMETYGSIINTGFVIGADAYSFTAPGDLSGIQFYVGVRYMQRFVLSQQYADVDGKAALSAHVQLRSMTVAYKDSGAFNTRVSLNKNSDAYNDEFAERDLTSQWAARDVGSILFAPNTAQIASGTHRFSVLGRASDVTITLSNDSYLPSTFVSGEWLGIVTLPSKQ